MYAKVLIRFILVENWDCLIAELNILALKVAGGSLDLFGHPVMAHLLILSPMLAHTQNLSILLS